MESFNNESSNKNILGCIPIENAYGERIIYNNDYPVTTNSKNINKLRVRLVDELNDPIQAPKDYTLNLQFINNEPR